jgi:hypothetical protein
LRSFDHAEPQAFADLFQQSRNKSTVLIKSAEAFSRRKGRYFFFFLAAFLAGLAAFFFLATASSSD